MRAEGIKDSLRKHPTSFSLKYEVLNYYNYRGPEGPIFIINLYLHTYCSSLYSPVRTS
jgi:hypothetical protein